MHTIAVKKLLMLRPGEILPARDTIRHSFDEYELKQLADSIATSGIIEPVSVRKNDRGAYELIAGERRLRAAKLAGLRRIPCVLHRTDDETAAFYAVAENLQRSSLSVFEEAESIRLLLEKYGLSKTETAIRLGITQSVLTEKLCLLRLDPALRERITDAGLTERHARALLRLPQEERILLLDRIIADGLTLRQTEKAVREMTSVELPLPDEPRQSRERTAEAPETPPEPVRKMAIGDLRLFANSLSKLLGTVQNAGIPVHSRKSETEKYIEYRIRIDKDSRESGCRQLKIC